jgi:cytochrome c biogenesis protein CcmG, thiol:disulfide interchange protein DsbE
MRISDEARLICCRSANSYWMFIARTVAMPEPVAIKGEVISCDSITSDKSITKGVTIECLDGSAGASMESLRGPMIINVWGSWCSTCLAETPEFVSFYKKAKGKVQLVGVAVEESSPDNSRKFIDRKRHDLA